MRYLLIFLLFGLQTAQAQETSLTLRPGHVAMTFWVNVDPAIVSELERGALVDLYFTEVKLSELTMLQDDVLVTHKVFEQIPLLNFNPEVAQIDSDYSAKILVQLEFTQDLVPKLVITSSTDPYYSQPYFRRDFSELVMTKAGGEVASQLEVYSFPEIEGIETEICTIRITSGESSSVQVIPCRD